MAAGRRSGGARRARAELDDPEAQDAVRDLQVVVQLLEQRGRAAELEQVVVGLGVLAHLVDRGAVAPVVPADDLARAIDRVLDVREDGVAPLLLDRGVEQQDEVVEQVLRWPCGGGW